MSNLNQLLIKKFEEEQIENERLELFKSLQDLAIINKQLTEYLQDSQPKVETIMDNLNSAHIMVSNGMEDLKVASEYSFKFLPVVLGVTIGVIIGGPFGFIPGFKAGGAIAAGGLGIIGGVAGYQIQK
jgi:hypothetical protein